VADKEPWAGLVKARGKLLNLLSDLAPTVEPVKLAEVRDAIDILIQERLAYAVKKKRLPIPTTSEPK
jgi:hypothetical protein